MKRPLLQVALLYAGGVLVAGLLPVALWLLLGAALGLALLAIGWARARTIVLYPLIVLAGWANMTRHTAVLSPHDLRRLIGDQPALVTVRGVLNETPSIRVREQKGTNVWRTMARVEVSAVSLSHRPWQPAVGRLAVTTPGLLTNLYAGQTVEITGVAAPPKGALAEGTFDYRAYLKEQGIYYHLQATAEADWQVLASPRNRPLGDRFRDWGCQALARGMPVEDESLRLEWALTLGWKTALTEEVSEPFVQAATYHIFAVDGLRMAIVFGILFGLLRALGVPRPISGLILIPLIWIFVND